MAQFRMDITIKDPAYLGCTAASMEFDAGRNPYSFSDRDDLGRNWHSEFNLISYSDGIGLDPEDEVCLCLGRDEIEMLICGLISIANHYDKAVAHLDETAGRKQP